MPTFASNVQPEQSGGIWYRYRQLDTTVPNVGNIRINVTLIGPTTTPLTNDPAQAYWTASAYTTPNDKKCHSDYYMAMFSTSGRKIGYGLSADDGFVIHPMNLALVYTDNKDLMVQYGCFRKNDNDALKSTCDVPVIYADIRIRPQDLTTQKQAEFDKIISTFLEPYCITADDIPRVKSLSQPYCEFTAPPDCTTRMVKGLGEIVVKPGATNNVPASKSGNSASACKWPLTIPGVKTHEPKNVTGLWYMYRKLYADEPNSVNQQYTVHNIGRGELPLSAIPAQWQWIEYSQYNGENDKTCHTGFWTGAVGNNGQQIGFDVMTLGQPMPVLNNMNGLYYDNTKFSVDYGCIIPNTKTNVCDKPFVYASTRGHPGKLSKADKDTFDSIINGLFQKYGCSVRDIPLIKFMDSKPACKYAQPTECISKAIQGLVMATKNVE
ncbi:uncharacterized protein LOC129599875 [Paramacrobiotus metropolitanus]|uniref:uncharacterized protein LOC129599875 n=1 Tax=Paramacrobiotus metropolitanus TaxID=2943436 RepID=UPI002445F959|nr:uncharacterized protein LOC129599875 [Paramacrobiotus metropolitanus]